MVKIIVCIKQALDVTELKVDSATRRIITVDAPRKISDFDKNARAADKLRIRGRFARTENGSRTRWGFLDIRLSQPYTLAAEFQA